MCLLDILSISNKKNGVFVWVFHLLGIFNKKKKKKILTSLHLCFDEQHVSRTTTLQVQNKKQLQTNIKLHQPWAWHRLSQLMRRRKSWRISALHILAGPSSSAVPMEELQGPEELRGLGRSDGCCCSCVPPSAFLGPLLDERGVCKVQDGRRPRPKSLGAAREHAWCHAADWTPTTGLVSLSHTRSDNDCFNFRLYFKTLWKKKLKRYYVILHL